MAEVSGSGVAPSTETSASAPTMAKIRVTESANTKSFGGAIAMQICFAANKASEFGEQKKKKTLLF